MNVEPLYDHPEFHAGYMKLRASREALNEALEIPAITDCIGSPAGKRVVDLGCGSGDMAIRLVQSGAAHVLGIDNSRLMLAKARRHELIDYRCEDLDALHLPSASVDLVVSSLALHYVRHSNTLIARISSWLRPGGRFAFSIEHPLCTAPMSLGDASPLNPWPLSDYADEGERVRLWFIPSVIKQHRTLTSVVSPLIRHGLRITYFNEPMPTTEQTQTVPEYHLHRVRPPLLVIGADAAPGGRAW